MPWKASFKLRLTFADDAKIHPNQWNFIAFSYDNKLKRGILQVGDSPGHHDISTGNDFPVSHDLVFNFDIYTYQKICNVERGICIG